MIRTIAIGLALTICPTIAVAQTGTGSAEQAALSRCLVDHASKADQTTLIKWIYGMMSASPEVQPLSSISKETRDGLSKEAGIIFNRLLTKDCRAQTVASIRTDGEDAIGESFGQLGKVAMAGLMGDPAVNLAMAALLDGIDARALAEVLIEGGADISGKSKNK